MTQDKIFNVTIQQLVFGGDGLARLPDGRAVFVPYVLPGEEVRIRLVEEKKSFARAVLEEITHPSAQRISPRCVHFGDCGGCHYQHMEYAQQLAVKQQVFIEQIRRISGLENPPVMDIRPSPQPWNYRNAVQFHISPDGYPGFQASGSHRLVKIQECHLPLPGIGVLWPQLQFDPQSELESVELIEGVDEEILMVMQGADLPPEVELDLPISVVHKNQDGDLILAGNSYVLMQVKDRVFSVSADSFFQVNSFLIDSMVDEVLAQVRLEPNAIVMDLYCGVGLFSAFLAPHVGEVIGVELSESACQDFSINLDEFDNVRLYQGAVEEILPQLEQKADLILVDPPRAGLDRAVIDTLIDAGAEQLVYISCDPPTLARDLKRLIQGGYCLEKIIPLDMFPQTYHVEAVVLLTRK